MTTFLSTEIFSEKEYEQYPTELRQVLRPGIDTAVRLTKAAKNGAISTAEYERLMRQLMRRMNTDAIMIGLDGELPDGLGQLLETHLAIQGDYFDNYMTDIRADGWTPKNVSRSVLYARSAVTSYHHGDVYRQAGAVLPLPAYPCEGTQCGNNCKCSWRIDVINADQNDYDAYWDVNSSETCQTCIQRGQQWSPIRIRGGVLQ